MSRLRAAAASIAVLLGAAACRDSGEPPREAASESGERRVVRTVNEPLRAMAARIGGDAFEVRYPGPADEDPAFWVPDEEEILGYREADLILRNGAGYAKWVAQASLPFARTVDTSASFAERLIEEAEVVTHAHGPEGEHAHGGTAFTTWLDYSLAAEQARAVEAALARLRPDRAEAMAARAAEVTAEFEALDERLLAVDPERRRSPLIASHPVYQYLARRYGLDVRSVHFEPDLVPDADGWATLDALLAERPASSMLWEGPPHEETVRGLDERGIRVVVFEPCGAPPADGDFFAIQRANVDRLISALR
ncbi:MAG: metal ABC transporter substrate-binding protein [Planctomycetota bacterium JB042]